MHDSKRGHSEGPKPHILKMKGKRAVVFTETQQGDKINASNIKDWTGNDTIEARNLYKKTAERFEMTAKIIVFSNFPLEIHNNDQAIKDRTKFFPFNKRFEKNEQFINDITAEHSPIVDSIFSYVVKTARESLINKRITHCETVERLTSDTFTEMDNIGQFLKECCELKEESKTRTAEVYDTYKQYCQRMGSTPITINAFSNELKKRGFEIKKSSVSWIMKLLILSSDNHAGGVPL